MSLKQGISIIVPVYNGEKYISQCISGIIKQLKEFDEIIIVDDGSADSTFEICSGFLDSCRQIKLFKKENGGVSSARNYGIERAANEWITFVDADDGLFESSLDVLRSSADSSVSMVVAGFTSKSIPQKRSGKKYFISSQAMIESILCCSAHLDYFPEESRYDGMGLWPCWGKLFRKSIINEYSIKFSEDLFLGEDLLFNLTYAKNIDEVEFVDEEIYFYRLSDSSVTAHFQPYRIDNTVKLCSKLKNELEGKYEKDFERFVASRAIACYQLYFASPSNPLGRKERKKKFLDFINSDMFFHAIKNTDGKELSMGKFQKYKYAIILMLMRYSMVGLLFKVKL